MNNLTLCIIVALAIVITEVVIDPLIWERMRSGKKKFIKEKLITNILRAALILGSGFLIPGKWFMNDLLIAGIFFASFDFVLNIVRWKQLPELYFYKVHHNIKFNTWDKIAYPVAKFTHKFFWHGDELTTSPYDKFFQWTPWPLELLIKGIILYLVIHFYQ